MKLHNFVDTRATRLKLSRLKLLKNASCDPEGKINPFQAEWKSKNEITFLRNKRI